MEMEAVLYVLAWVTFFFWLIQLIDVLFRDRQYFENHTHKLTWFLVVLVGNIVGAVWYFRWKREAVHAHESARSQIQLEETIEAWRQDQDSETAEPEN